MDPQISNPESWKVPRELARALPREISISAAGTFIVILSICVAVGAAVLHFYMHHKSERQTAEANVLRTSGRVTSGEVTRLWRADKGDDCGVAYRFLVDGHAYQGQATAPSAIWRDLHVGGPLPVRYNPAGPEINHPSDWDPHPLPSWVSILIPAMLLLCPLILMLALRRQASLLANGHAAMAVVRKVGRTKGGWMVRYDFQAGGATFKGGTVQARKPEVGETLTVLYDPERPRRNRTYPVSWYRASQF